MSEKSAHKPKSHHSFSSRRFAYWCKLAGILLNWRYVYVWRHVCDCYQNVYWMKSEDSISEYIIEWFLWIGYFKCEEYTQHKQDLFDFVLNRLGLYNLWRCLCHRHGLTFALQWIRKKKKSMLWWDQEFFSMFVYWLLPLIHQTICDWVVIYLKSV